jgi:5-methylcytosine-specific restriction endonuclease McrA
VWDTLCEKIDNVFTELLEWRMAKRICTYYQRNRAKRLAYQHEWYRQHKVKQARQEELLEVLEPESLTPYRESRALKRERVRAYSKAYYAKNRKRIRQLREARRFAAKVTGGVYKS